MPGEFSLEVFVSDIMYIRFFTTRLCAASLLSSRSQFTCLWPDRISNLNKFSMNQPTVQVAVYRGSQKHKHRPTSERKGTLCPEWTHRTASGGYANDPFAHKWAETEAHRLFDGSIPHANGQRRYALSNGIAFEAKPTNDGTWHGYPIPWEAVPTEILNGWVDGKMVSQRQIRKHWRKEKDDLKWAIEEGN